MSSTAMNMPKTWIVPTPDQISCDLFGINTMMIYPFRKKNDQKFIQGNIDLHFVKRESWISGKIQRKLVNEALGTFLSLQKAAKDGSGEPDFKPLLVKKTREYRSMIQACISQEGNTDVQNLESNKNGDLSAINDICELLYKMELILGLIEVTFLDTQIGGSVLNQLLHWIRFHFPHCRQKMSECLEAEQPELCPSYWEACYGLVLQGSIEECRELLSHHPKNNSDAFISLNELLRKMPIYLVYSGISEGEFTIRWQHWQSECNTRLEKGEFAEFPELQTICSILCGDLNTMLSLASIVDTWYHLMVSYLLFTNPTIKIHRLPSAANDAVLAFFSREQLSSLDKLLIAIFEVNHPQVIKACQTVFDNLWFAVHLTDLLHHSLPRETELSYVEDIRENLIMDYATELSSHASLWQVGLLYLDHCPSALPFTEAILERIPLTDDHKALKLIQAASSRNLHNIVKTICCVMGRSALKKKQLGSAIWWGLRSRDSAFTSHLAHQILQNYMRTGHFDSSSLLDNLGPLMLLSDTLTFLNKYKEFHVLYQEGNLKDAATLLVNLMSSKLAPKYFWPVLLEDALPLLQSPEPVISAEQTYSLMYCLQNLTSEKHEDSSLPYYASFYAKETDLRLAMTNNLARAIIVEGTQVNL